MSMTQIKLRAYRGGSWRNDVSFAGFVRSYAGIENSRNLSLGFRLVRELNLPERLAETLQESGGNE